MDKLEHVLGIIIICNTTTNNLNALKYKYVVLYVHSYCKYKESKTFIYKHIVRLRYFQKS